MSTEHDRHPRRAVVTGGAGFLGSHLCERLLAEAYEVVCVDNLVTGGLDNIGSLIGRPGFRFVRADACQPLAVGGRVDVVCHLASLASPQEYLRRPLETLRVGSQGTMAALELAEARRARFLLASTSEVYGDPVVHPQVETYWGNVNPVGPRAVYDESKRFAEAVTAAYRRRGVDTGIVRIFNTYGPRMRRDDGRLVPNFVGQALAGRPLTVYGDGTQTRSLCHVDDLVDGLFRMVRSDHPGPVNLGNPQERTVLELAELIRSLAGATSPVEHRPAMTDDPTRRRPDITLAGRELGWAPRIDMATGLLDTITWFAGRLGHPSVPDLTTTTTTGGVA